MDKAAIIAKLREHEGELRSAGVEHLSLFGSWARGTARGRAARLVGARYGRARAVRYRSHG
jgi:hypothetical protein